MTEAAGVLVVYRGRILAISRGHNRSNLGLPGGRTSPEDSSARHTAARELLEETGVVVSPGRLRFVADNRTPSGGVYALYMPMEIISWPKRLRSEPFEGFVGWHHPDELVSPRCRHANFHRRMLARI